MFSSFSNTQYKTRGFTMLELTIVIIMISVLLAIAIDRLLKLQIQAERAAMESIIGNLQSAIALTISEHIAKDRMRALRKFIHSNPMDLLANIPINYMGSYPDAPKNPESASWWFEEKTGTLIYHVMNKDYFSVQNGDLGLIKFKILPVYDDINGNKRFDRQDTLRGLQLKALSKYHWLSEPMNPEQMANSLNNSASSN